MRSLLPRPWLSASACFSSPCRLPHLFAFICSAFICIYLRATRRSGIYLRLLARHLSAFICGGVVRCIYPASRVYCSHWRCRGQQSQRCPRPASCPSFVGGAGVAPSPPLAILSHVAARHLLVFICSRPAARATRHRCALFLVSRVYLQLLATTQSAVLESPRACISPPPLSGSARVAPNPLRPP